MLLSLFASFLGTRTNLALRLLTGLPPASPNFDGLLDELYASWPLDARETEGRLEA